MSQEERRVAKFARRGYFMSAQASDRKYLLTDESNQGTRTQTKVVSLEICQSNQQVDNSFVIHFV